MDEFDDRMMQRALTLARRGQGRVEPNPMVGCVIVRKGRRIGEGYHRRFGDAHAEIDALRRCSSSPRGATVYVTLEPCCHFGKTPPCTKTLVDARIAEVVFPFRDPNPAVNGGGVRELRRAGIRVRTGIGVAEAAEVLAPFLTVTSLKRPYVIAKWAQTPDGRLVTGPDEPRWISGERSRRRVQRLRARVDAVLVGIGTVLADDPLLNARDVPVRRLAARVVLDSRLRIPEFSRLVATAEAIPLWVMTTAKTMTTRKARALQRRGVRLVACGSGRGPVSPSRVLGALAARGMTNVLVEGGPTVLNAFLRAGLVDEALVFVGSCRDEKRKRGTPSGLHDGCVSVDAASRALSVNVRRSGDDTLHHYRLTQPPIVTAS